MSDQDSNGTAENQTNSPDAITYPKRESYYANRLMRLMTKTAAAQQMGPDATLLVATVAFQEDAKRYRALVSFYNSQLLPLLGFAKWERLDRSRRAATEAGRLQYREQGTRKPGLYWATIPPDLENLPDGAIDEALSPAEGYEAGYRAGYREGFKAGIKTRTTGESSGMQSGDNEGDPPNLFLPPIPTPTPEEPLSGETDEFQTVCAEFVEIWSAASGVRPIRKMSDNRRHTLRTRLKDPEWDWHAALGKFPLLCTRDQQKGWRPNVDWYLRPDSVTKILEGNYGWAKSNGQNSADRRDAITRGGLRHDPAAGVDGTI